MASTFDECLATLPCTLLTAETDFFENPHDPFIYTDLFTARAAAEKAFFLHFWQLEPTIIFGMKDTRTPHFLKGAQHLQANQYRTVIRNAGGLAVAADPGVLNFSLIFPVQPHETSSKITIDQAYEAMTQIIQQAFATPEHPIEAFEIQNSYCPGDFDLSIAGQKFAGLAQRRVKNGISVMAYLSISGDQGQRGGLIHDFYQLALAEAFGTDGYPAVDPQIMTNLPDLLGTPFSVATAKKRILQVVSQLARKPIHTQPFATWFQEEAFAAAFTAGQQKMQQRNQILE